MLKYFSSLSPANHTAGDLGSCVTGRLRVKIIRAAVDHHSSSKDILNPETTCSHSQMGTALLHHQGRQIACVFGMVDAIGIIVAACLRKACAGAAVSFMNVKSEETGFAVLRKTGYISHHQHAARFLIKPNLAVYIWCVRSASDISHCIRTAGVSKHKITSLQLMPECGGLFKSEVRQVVLHVVPGGIVVDSAIVLPYSSPSFL